MDRSMRRAFRYLTAADVQDITTPQSNASLTQISPADFSALSHPAKAIQTTYRGYRFRSRLEARWAVFFDKMGIQFEYEKEGYDLGEAGTYLPDFWLPQVNMWAEVKPTEFTITEALKIEALFYATGFPVLKLIGPPDFKEYDAFEAVGMENEMGYIPFSLISMYLHDEHRFFCQGYPEPGDSDYWPADYRAAVFAARSARFERGEKG